MTNPCLAVAGLNAWYGESQALFGVDLTVATGETVAILGRNGAGKSTTLKCILGIVPNRAGSVKVDGVEIGHVARHKIARYGLGYVPEHRGIFASLTVEENLSLIPPVSDHALSMEELYDLFPNLLERRKSYGTKLSGGEQQMLALARILRAGATTLLLDEPTEGLAPVIVEAIGRLLAKLKSRGMTILLVEQNYAFTLSLADRFYLLEVGKVVGCYDRASIEANNEVIARTLGV